MAKIIQKYLFTTKELDEYASSACSCVRKVNSEMHIKMGPYGLAEFKQSLYRHLVQTKVGFYDFHLNGIVLGIKNIKVLGTTANIRADDPILHINIKADFYVFCPEEGVVVGGIVKHVSHRQVSVIIYRVFNVAIRHKNKLNKDEVKMNQEIQFRIKQFDLQSIFPYIEGEIILPESKGLSERQFKKMDTSKNGADSGFEEKEDTKSNHELEELLLLIKEEQPTPTKDVDVSQTTKKKKDKKRKRQLSESEVPVETNKIINKKIKKEKKIKVEPIDID